MGNASSSSTIPAMKEQTPSVPAGHSSASEKDTKMSGNPPLATPMSAEPPRAYKPETFEQKLWRKFTEHPLIPFGCAATTYFLASGIRSFNGGDQNRSQRMMRGRVSAQLFTILAFVGYMGMDYFDFRAAPFTQDAMKNNEANSET